MVSTGCLPVLHDHDSDDTDSDFYDTDLELEDVHPQKSGFSEEYWNNTQTLTQSKISECLERRIMNLQYRSLGASCVASLGRSLKDNMRVEKITLDNCNISSEGLQHLVNGLIDNVTVYYLNVANNGLGYEGAKWIEYLLLKNKFITHVVASGNKFGDDTAPFIGRIIEMNNTLKYLDLSYNQLREKAGQLIGVALGENSHLETLKLGWNSIRNHGAVSIGQSLQNNQTLKVLNVNMNGFGYGGSLALSISLKRNTSLEELDVSNNNINWKAALLISQGLRENTKLRVLRIGRNSLTTTGCMDLVEAASHHTSFLKYLNLQGVSVLEETKLLADAIGQYRDFKMKHGGVVASPDVLGQREEKEENNMSKLIKFIKTTMTRSLELLRDFDKTTTNFISEEEFVRRMEKVGVPLHKYQMRELAREVCSSTDGIDYKKLSDAITSQIVRDRMRLYRERREKQKLQIYNETILENGLPSFNTSLYNKTGRRSQLSSVSKTSLISNNEESGFRKDRRSKMTSFPDIYKRATPSPSNKHHVKNCKVKTKKLCLSSPLDTLDKQRPYWHTTPTLALDVTQGTKTERKKTRLCENTSKLHPIGGTCVEIYT